MTSWGSQWRHLPAPLPTAGLCAGPGGGSSLLEDANTVGGSTTRLGAGAPTTGWQWHAGLGPLGSATRRLLGFTGTKEPEGLGPKPTWSVVNSNMW